MKNIETGTKLDISYGLQQDSQDFQRSRSILEMNTTDTTCKEDLCQNTKIQRTISIICNG